MLILSNTTASSVTDTATAASTGIPFDTDDSSSATTTIDKVEATGGTQAPSVTPPVVAPPVVTPPATPVVVPKATLPVAVLPESGRRTLPFTGTNVRLLLLAGLGLLLLGLGLVAGTWRMPRARHYR
ncbi:MAG: hypothetical protein NVS1B12_14560 [Acidimicrobiales bacterium]